MHRILTLRLLLVCLPLAALVGVAVAQSFEPTPFDPPASTGELFGTAEILYALLVLPLVQFLKSHRPLAPLFEALGDHRRYGVIGLSIVVGIVLTVAAQFGQLFDYGGLRPAITFGITVGLVNSGVKQLMNAQRRSIAPPERVPEEVTR